MNATGQEIVRMLLELQPIVTADGKREIVTMEAIRKASGTVHRQNVVNWLKGVYDPQPHHLTRLKQMLLTERARRQPDASPERTRFAHIS